MAVAVDWLPSGAKLDLVRVGLNPNSTIADFKRVHRSIAVAQMDWAFAEMLPLFAARFGCDDGRINGLRRHHFYVNTMTLARVNDAVVLLAESGVACVLGGGLAVITAYPDLSCRSLPDAELIVAAADLERASAAMAAAAWTVNELDRLRHEKGGVSVTLTPRLRGTVEGLVGHADEVESITTTLTGRALPIVTPEIAVVETAVAAVWPKANAPIRWVIDLERLLVGINSTSSVDAIVRHARAHGAAQLLRVALRQAQRLGVRSVPPGLLRKLALVPVTRLERSAVLERTSVSRSRFWRERFVAAIPALGLAR